MIQHIEFWIKKFDLRQMVFWLMVEKLPYYKILNLKIFNGENMKLMLFWIVYDILEIKKLCNDIWIIEPRK